LGLAAMPNPRCWDHATISDPSTLDQARIESSNHALGSGMTA